MEVDATVDLFYDLVNAAVSDYIPTVHLTKRYPPWFDNKVELALREKETAFTAKNTLAVC